MLDAFYLAALCAVTPGLGRSRIPKLIKFFGSAKTVYEAQMYDLLQSGICTVRQIENFIANRKPELPEKLFAFCSRHCVKLITIYDAAYPEALKEIHDFPLVLYVRGVLPVSKYNLAIVGSREASPYGLKAAGMFAAAFVRSIFRLSAAVRAALIRLRIKPVFWQAEVLLPCLAAVLILLIRPKINDFLSRLPKAAHL